MNAAGVNIDYFLIWKVESRMKAAGVEPDEWTYNSLISAVNDTSRGLIEVFEVTKPLTPTLKPNPNRGL